MQIIKIYDQLIHFIKDKDSNKKYKILQLDATLPIFLSDIIDCIN